MPTAIAEFEKALEENERDYGVQLTSPARKRLGRYYELLRKWNERLHLVAPCSPAEFATRHVLESLVMIRHLSHEARVADVGSGAGLPIIPSLVVREDLQAILIESAARKAVFLREALRATGCEQRAQVIARRFQDTVVRDSNFVRCRALDRFESLLPALVDWSPEISAFLVFAGEELVERIRMLFTSVAAEKLPNSERRFLVVAQGRRAAS